MRQTPAPLREMHHLGQGTRERVVSCPALATHALARVGLTTAASEYRFQRLKPQRSHLVASLAGLGQCWLAGTWHDLPPGTAYLAPAGLPHGFASAHERWQLAWCSWDGPVDNLTQPSVVRADGQPLALAIQGLAADHAADAPGHLLRAWADLIELQARRIADPLSGPLSALWCAVDDDPGQPWTLERLSAVSGLSREQLRRLCQRVHGCAPMQRVARIRLDCAAAMLGDPDRPLIDIASAVGYATTSAFCTAFRRQHGQPPARFRALVDAG